MNGRAFLVATLLLLPPPAGGPSVRDHLDAAKALLEKKDVRGALDRIGDGLLLAHKEGDLLAEWMAAEALEEVARELPADAPRGAARSAPQGVPHRREAMGLLMKKLDPKRQGAFVTPGILARKLILLSSERGDEVLRDEAEDILSGWEAGKKSGEATVFYTTWTISMSSMNMLGPVGKGNTDGFVFLRRDILRAVAHDWADEVTHAVTEHAAFYVRFQDPMDGLDAMKQGEKVCLQVGDADVVRRWEKVVDARLAGAPDKLKEPLRRLSGKFPATQAGAGGAGREAAPTGLGVAFPKMKKDAPLVRVKRTDTGFDVMPAWNPKAKFKAVHGPGVRYLEADGLILMFEGRGVGVHAVDLEGRLALPGNGSPDTSFRAIYTLAKAETWTLRKDGTVTVMK
jgi:hypothetical protein